MDLSVSEDQPKVEGIVTSCRDCVFAIYEGNEQCGCDFDRLEKFEGQGGRIVGQDDSYKRYFLVVGRHPQKDWAAIVAGEFRVRCAFLIYVDGTRSLDDVRTTLDSVLDQGPIQPSRVEILLNAPRELAREYVHIIRNREPAITVPWEVRDLVVHSEGVPVNQGHAIDIGLKSLEGSTYYASCHAGYVWPPNTLVRLNHAINYEMIRIAAVLPDEDGNGLVMLTSLHNKWLHGNADRPVLEKLEEVALLEDTRHMIKTWEELSCV
jgi:hypothetical protein